MKARKTTQRWAKPYLRPRFERKAKGKIEIQSFGFARDGKTPICAGVHHVREITPRILWKMAQHWKRWRKWYDNLPENRALDYHAKHDPMLGFWGAHPIAAHGQTQWLEVSR